MKSMEKTSLLLKTFLSLELSWQYVRKMSLVFTFPKLRQEKEISHLTSELFKKDAAVPGCYTIHPCHEDGYLNSSYGKKKVFHAHCLSFTQKTN